MATNVKVLLKSNVENLGSGGDIVKVRPGFARNYLLPRGFAVPATAGNLQRVEELRRTAAQQAHEELSRAKEVEVRLGAVSVQIERAAGDEDRMWGSVTSRDIAEAFARVGVELDRRKIQLKDPIKTFGPAEISIRLHPDVNAALKIDVVKKK
ncbi:MAG TPA: 50S ribosomal protein L9 [Polyangiaceae bacterium]